MSRLKLPGRLRGRSHELVATGRIALDCLRINEPSLLKIKSKPKMACFFELSYLTCPYSKVCHGSREKRMIRCGHIAEGHHGCKW